MTGYVDLHVHTTASDGTLSPSELVKLAVAKKLTAIAITDHDTVSGYNEARNAAGDYDLEVISGIEINSRYSRSVHVLGYLIDQYNAELVLELNKIVEERDRRNREICTLMQKDGLPVDYEKLKQRFGKIVGRPHFAKILFELGLVNSIQAALSLYLEKDRRYYLPRNALSVERSIEVIRTAGGIPVLGHPFQYQMDDHSLRELIKHCLDYGLAGIECFYSGYNKDQIRYLIALANEYNLLITGGSDFHGSVKPNIMLGSGTGNLCVPYRCLQELRNWQKKSL